MSRKFLHKEFFAANFGFGLAFLKKKASASRRPTASEAILAEISKVEEKLACGEGMGAPMEAPMSYMEMEAPMSYMDDDIINRKRNSTR